MDDIEITRKCAEAMGYRVGNLASKIVAFDVSPHAIIASNDSGGESVYDPLNNDAQAMALARKFPYEFEQSVIEWCNHLRRGELFNLNHYFCQMIANRES